jgi:outer membrane protein assembly factor BamB
MAGTGLYVWETESGKLLDTYVREAPRERRCESEWRICFANETCVLISEGYRLSARDVAKRQLLWQIEQDKVACNTSLDLQDLVALGEGNLVGVTFQGEVLTVDWRTGKINSRHPIPETIGYSGKRLSPDGRKVIACGGLHVKAWDTRSGELLWCATGFPSIQYAGFLCGQRLVYVYTSCGKIYFLSGETGRVVEVTSVRKLTVCSPNPAISDGKLAVPHRWLGMLEIYDFGAIARAAAH